jgi:hypothetical protein
VPGEYVADGHTIVVGPDIEPGSYRLAVGLYDPVSGARLTLPDGSDRLILEPVLSIPPVE